LAVGESLHGWTPGKLLQISTSRAADHISASAVSSCRLPNVLLKARPDDI
jgi:hypothetical protein